MHPVTWIDRARHEPKCLLSPPAATYSHTEHLEQLEGERLSMFLGYHWLVV
jgi:hypothetical protein